MEASETIRDTLLNLMQLLEIIEKHEMNKEDTF